MKNNKVNRREQSAELRRQAEEIVLEKAVVSPENLGALSPEETCRMLHELNVHQIELKMQNEELRRYLLELDATRARYLDLFDQAPVGYCITSEKGLVMEANLTAATLLGVTRDEMIKQPFFRFIHKEDQDIYYFQRKHLFEAGKPWTYDLRMVKNDGTSLWIHLTATAAQGADGEPVCRIVMNDSTERNQAEEKIRALNKELQDSLQKLTDAKAFEDKAKHAKSDFLANISHELTTPLNHIIGFSQVLLTNNFGDLNEKQQRYVETILNSGERLHNMLTNIVSFVRMDVSNPDMAWEDFPLKSIVDLSMSVFRKSAIARHLTLTLNIEKEADRMIRADRGKLLHVFQIILSNAVKFSREGGQITLSVCYRKDSEESGKDGFMEVKVEDTGIGIKAEDILRIFRPFEQIEAPLTKQYAGVSMGLALASKVIEAHGGVIRVESDYGKGSRFIFTIPVKDGYEK